MSEVWRTELREARAEGDRIAASKFKEWPRWQWDSKKAQAWTGIEAAAESSPKANQRVMIEEGIVTKTVNEIDLRYVDDS